MILDELIRGQKFFFQLSFMIYIIILGFGSFSYSLLEQFSFMIYVVILEALRLFLSSLLEKAKRMAFQRYTILSNDIYGYAVIIEMNRTKNSFQICSILACFIVFPILPLFFLFHVDNLLVSFGMTSYVDIAFLMYNSSKS